MARKRCHPQFERQMPRGFAEPAAPGDGGGSWLLVAPPRLSRGVSPLGAASEVIVGGSSPRNRDLVR
jgi:hypothetical protein